MIAHTTDERVVNRFAAALSEMHVETGWCCYDSGIDGCGYFNRAAQLADEAGDAFGIVNAAWQAGVTMVRSGHPDDALKCFQLGQFQLMGHTRARPVTFGADDPRMQTIAAWLNVKSATAYALMGHPQEAKCFLGKARENWQPPGVFERAATDRATAEIHLDLGHLNISEQFAQSAVRSYDGNAHRRGKTRADLVLAEVNVRAGEPRGLTMAKTAIDAVSTLLSVGVQRERLVPLAEALDAHPGGDARELARTARKVAATRV